MRSSILISIVVFTIVSTQSLAQRIIWACRVDRVSSELRYLDSEYPGLNRRQFAKEQLLGKPNVYPSGGLNSSAWTSGKKKQLEFIAVSFCEDIDPRQIVVFQTMNPGSIVHLVASDKDGKSYDLGKFNPREDPQESRLMSIFVDPSVPPISKLKIEFNKVFIDQLAIDAVGITDWPIPINYHLDIVDTISKNTSWKRLTEKINSPSREFNPVPTPDQKKIFFSRAHHPMNSGGVSDIEDIWSSTWDDERKEWTEAAHIDSKINNSGPNFISSVHANGDTLVFLMGNKYVGERMAEGLSIFKYYNNEWRGPYNLDIPGFYNYSDQGNFFLSSDETVLMFSVSRDDSAGDRDLYVSFKKHNQWSEPLNLGSDVNTAGRDVTPFLLPDKKTLFFSSDGHSNFGGTDIFMTKRLDDTWKSWAMPKNLGTVINSNEDDLGLTAYGNKVYFVRGKQENTDIFELTGDLFEDHEVIVVQETQQSDIHPDSTILKQIEADLNEVFTAEIVYFDFDKSDLKPEFDDYLRRVTEYLLKYDVTVELYGHTDAIGSIEYNSDLGIRRAEAVARFLEENGVPKGRIVTRGFGEHQPAHPNTHPTGQDNPEGRKMNRRVEFLLISIGKQPN